VNSASAHLISQDRDLLESKTIPYLSQAIRAYDLPDRGFNLRCPFIDKGIAMTDLHETKCVACRAGEPTLTDGEINMLHPQIPEWQVKEVDGVKRLERVFKFKDFAQALEFANRVGAIAEQEDHHPMITTEYGRVTVNWWTHMIGGLHRNNFIMAAKTDQLL
jgi:4a-hydroxytetrahydrobiopterin dehydratase